jgi:hypothetical protein
MPFDRGLQLRFVLSICLATNSRAHLRIAIATNSVRIGTVGSVSAAGEARPPQWFPYALSKQPDREFQSSSLRQRTSATFATGKTTRSSASISHCGA